MTGRTTFERKLTPDDVAALSAIDAWLDTLNAAQMRAAAEYFAAGVAMVRPTHQTMTEWMDAAKAAVGR